MSADHSTVALDIFCESSNLTGMQVDSSLSVPFSVSALPPSATSARYEDGSEVHADKPLCSHNRNNC